MEAAEALAEENKELKRDLKEIRKARGFTARIRHPEYWMPILAGGVAIAIAIMGYFDGKNATPPGQTVALSPNAEGGDGAFEKCIVGGARGAIHEAAMVASGKASDSETVRAGPVAG